MICIRRGSRCTAVLLCNLIYDTTLGENALHKMNLQLQKILVKGCRARFDSSLYKSIRSISIIYLKYILISCGFLKLITSIEYGKTLQIVMLIQVARITIILSIQNIYQMQSFKA